MQNILKKVGVSQLAMPLKVKKGFFWFPGWFLFWTYSILSPDMKPDQKGNFGVLAIFTVILLVALTGASVYFWQNYEKEKALKTVEVKTEEKTEEKTETPTPAPPPTPAEESKAPVVVFP